MIESRCCRTILRKMLGVWRLFVLSFKIRYLHLNTVSVDHSSGIDLF